MTEYEVSVTNSFEADTPEDAVRQMVEWLTEEAAYTGYRVCDEAGFVGWYDGDDCDPVVAADNARLNEGLVS
jgi:hypothetical protein